MKDLDIFQNKFHDLGNWRKNIGSFKSRYWQFEAPKGSCKWVLLNSNSAGVEYLLEQIKNLQLNNYCTESSFALEQDIEKLKLRTGYSYPRVYPEDEDFPYNGDANLTGYKLDIPEGRNTPFNKVYVKWHPETIKRTLSITVDYETFELSIHLNHEGLNDLLHILEIYANLYHKFDIFCPNQDFITNYGNSKFHLTNIVDEILPNQVVHCSFFREYEFPKAINIFSGIPNKEDIFFQSGPIGALELEAIFSYCIKVFNQVDYIDYQITCTNSGFIPDYANNKETVQVYTKVRFVFWRDSEAEFFSLEYDPKQDILYVFISYLRLLELLDNFVKLQWNGWHRLEYYWNRKIEDNINAEDYKFFSNNIRIALVNCSCGNPALTKFTYLKLIDLQELRYPNPSIRDRYLDERHVLANANGHKILLACLFFFLF